MRESERKLRDKKLGKSTAAAKNCGRCRLTLFVAANNSQQSMT